MAKIVDLDVKTISIETIKPSTPTPSHLKTYTLSLLDQMFPAYYTVLLLFYPKTTESPHDRPNINVLKDSLSKTLSKYYPFAGRCIHDCTVSCDDQGIPFIETRVDCALSDFLNSSNKINYMHKLTSPENFMTDKPLPERFPLVIQVNVFSCGGVVIGVFKLHKLLLDGTSLTAFLKHWAALTAASSGRNRDNITIPAAPDFDAVVSLFPPNPSLCRRPFDFDCPELREMKKGYQGMRVVAKSFVFTKHAISALKAKAASEEVPKPTRFEALAGFVWIHCMAVACATGAMPEGLNPSGILLVVNMRPRLKPALTSTTMGNLITLASVSANEDMTLTEVVREIHVAVTKKCDNIEAYKRGQNIDTVVVDFAPIIWYKPGMYGLSSLCQFKLDEIDFGFGQPKWVSPTNGLLSPLFRNFIYFVTDTEGDEIEVWLFLEEKEMQILESDQKFLAFAHPK